MRQSMMDDEKKIILLKTYREYHLNNEAGIKEELLVEQGRELLSSRSVKPNNRFLALDIDVYKNVLGNIAEKFENNEESINKMKAGFNSLEKYAINLWKFPWRKEYHSIKLYTAFFKCNVQNQLQDLDTILFILKSLGYNKSEQHRDEVTCTVKEPDRESAIWVSLDLFLIQVDLEMIKEIMKHFNDGKLSLRQLVKARSRTYDVKDACNYLTKQTGKRQKREAQQESEAASHREVPSGKINSTRDDKRVVAHAVQSTRSDSNDSIMSNTTEARAMDTDVSSTGSVGNKGDPSADMPTNSKDDISRWHVMNPAQFGDNFSDHDLYGLDPVEDQPTGTTRNRFDARGSVLPQIRFPHSSRVSKGGSYSLPYLGHQHFTQSHANVKGGDLQGIIVDNQSYPVQPATRNKADTAPTRLNGSSGSDRYVNLRGTRSSANHPQSANTTRRNDTNVVAGYRGTSVPEPMEVEQAGRTQEMQNNFTALPNGMAEGAHARPANRSGVGDLNTTMEHQLTIAPNSASLADKTKEQRKPYDSQRYTSGKDATQFQDRTTREYSSKSSLYIKNNLTSDAEAARNFREHMGERTDAKNASAVPSGSDLHYKPSAAHGDVASSHQRAAEIQHSTHSARNDLCIGSASNGMMSPQAGKTLQKDPTAICDMCPSEGISICKNCRFSVCGKCKNYYSADLCGKNKVPHHFEEFKKTMLQQRSADVEAPSGQHGAIVNESMVDDGKEWPCSRCTFLNPPEYKICTICASSRGFSSLNQTEFGSRVCGSCTFHNKVGTTVCEACHKTLSLSGPEETAV